MRRTDKAIFAAFCSTCALGAAAGSPAPGPNLVAAALATVAAVTAATPLALALGRLRFEGRALAFTILILASATSPSLIEAGGASLSARFTSGLALGVPIATWIVYILARALPRELEDATVLDGASLFQVWLPALRPAMLAATPLVFFFCAFDLAVR